jgi:hypothetical protein
MKPTIPSEHVEQSMLVQWFRRSYPNVLIFAIPNGGARSKATAGKLKVEGVVPGIPDLFVPEWKLWIEMKRTKGGSLSPEQNLMHLHLRGLFYKVLVAKGFEDAKQQIEELRNEVDEVEQGQSPSH